jgi:hypothetical protein
MKRLLLTFILIVLAGVPAFAQESTDTQTATDTPAMTTIEPAVQTADAPAQTVETPAPAKPADDTAKGFGIGNKYVKFTGRMQNLFVWRNDSDFDRTPPYYKKNGQDIGLLGTFLAPTLIITPVKELKMVFEMELGLNMWSMQDPDAYAAASPSWFRMAIRQAYTEANFLDGKIGFRVGYEQLFDPTGMFIGHWLGAASVWTKHDWGQLTLTVAQMPDQTFEGVAFDANNFNTDTILYGLRLQMPFDKLSLSAAIWGLHDTQIIDQTLDMMAITANFGGDWKWLKFGVDLGFQYGTTDTRAGGKNETTIAWAAQGFLTIDKPVTASGDLSLLFNLNTMALSGDDKYDGNNHNGAWFYSGKSRSRTMILTEDEVRDRGGNLDEVMSEKRDGESGKFYLNRAGISVTDASIGLKYKDFFRPMVTIGAGWALNGDNALGKNFIGLETDLHLEFMYKKYLSVDFVGSYLLPGQAAAAFMNRTDNRESTDSIYQFETSVTLYF